MEQRFSTNAYKYTYWYDSLGNRTTMVYNTSTTVYGYNTLNQVTAVYAGDTHYYGYDENGNRSNEVVYIGGLAHLYSYDYDADNRLINKRTQGGGGGVSYTYCGLGKRVMKVKDGNTTVYYHNGLNTVTELYKSSTESSFRPVAAYTLGLGAIGQIISVRQYGTTTTDLYYHYDPIGNVQFITDSYGNVTVSYVQEGFGNIIATIGSLTSNFYHLTSKEVDPDTGLYYFGGRWYDPVIGRFITKDILSRDNRYSYCFNKPTRFIDPTGYIAQVNGCTRAQETLVRLAFNVILDKMKNEYGRAPNSGVQQFFGCMKSKILDPRTIVQCGGLFCTTGKMGYNFQFSRTAHICLETFGPNGIPTIIPQFPNKPDDPRKVLPYSVLETVAHEISHQCGSFEKGPVSALDIGQWFVQ